MKYTIVFLCLLITNIFGQTPNKTHEIKGLVMDASTKQPLPFASITVYKIVDTKETLIGGVNTPESGVFVLGGLPAGNLIVKVSFIYYKTVSQAIMVNTPSLDMGTIALSPDNTVLQEVEVKGEKEAASFSMDKRVFNVAKSLTSIGGTAEALLRNVPSISLDESGNASIRNLATTIYINGKPTQLTLAQIPANQIESVEVISNPSARYDASTSGGIVNLILKKNRQAGYNGSASVGIGNNARYDASINLDYHQDKWTFNVLYNLNATKNPLNSYVQRTTFAENVPSTFFNQNTLTNLDNLFQNGRLSIEYASDKHNTFTLAGNMVGGAFNTIANQSYDYKNAQQVITSFGTRNTVPANNYTNVGVELDWKHSFAQKGKELSVITSFTRNNVSNAADWFTTSLNADGSEQVNFPETDKITGRQIGSQYLFQADYVKPLNDSSKIEMGVRSFTYQRDIQYFFNRYNTKTQSYDFLESYSQDGTILETINAAYFLYSQKLKKNISLQAGLRLEQSFLHGTSRFDNSTFGYDYPSAGDSNWLRAFFPSFSVSKKLDNDSELGLSLSRKVGRPNFRHLFVGIQANDRQNITVGNPKIQPEFINAAELSYNKTFGRLSWLSTAYYVYEDHTIKPFTQPSATDPSILVTTFVNTKADIQYGIDNTLKYTAGPFSVVGNLNVYHFLIQSVDRQNEMFTYRSKLTLSYRFPASIVAQVNMNRDAKSPTLQGYRLAVQAADFAVRKSFMKNRASVAFTINDIFNSRKYISIYEQGNTYQTTMNRRDVRFYKISLQLPIGKPNATFRKKERGLDKPDVDFGS